MRKIFDSQLANHFPSAKLMSYNFPEKVVFRSVRYGAHQDVPGGHVFAPEAGHPVDLRSLTAAAAVERIVQ
jgi:hypothetical protein